MIIYLVILSAILILFNIKSLRKEKLKNGFSSILKNEEENVTDTTVEILRLRKDLSETIVELQREIVDLKEEVNYLRYRIKDEKIQSGESFNVLVSDEYVKASNNEKEIYAESLNKNKTKSEVKKENNDNKKENANSNKIKEIKSLINQGLSDDEICKKLSLGKGELLLIKGLYN